MTDKEYKESVNQAFIKFMENLGVRFIDVTPTSKLVHIKKSGTKKLGKGGCTCRAAYICPMHFKI